MKFVTRLITAYFVALALVALPFSSSFGLLVTDADHSTAGSPAESLECDSNTDDLSCLQLSGQDNYSDTEDACCTDHCDSFSGAQICPDSVQVADNPLTDEFTAARPPQLADLTLSRLLRPPRQIS